MNSTRWQQENGELFESQMCALEQEVSKPPPTNNMVVQFKIQSSGECYQTRERLRICQKHMTSLPYLLFFECVCTMTA